MSTIEKAIAEACKGTDPFTKERSKALSKVKWAIRAKNSNVDIFVMRTYAANQRETFTDLKSKAQIYDGRDNHVTRVAFWETLTGESLEAVLV